MEPRRSRRLSMRDAHLVLRGKFGDFEGWRQTLLHAPMATQTKAEEKEKQDNDTNKEEEEERTTNQSHGKQERRPSKVEYYTAVVMRRFSNPFSSLSHKAGLKKASHTPTEDNRSTHDVNPPKLTILSVEDLTMAPRRQSTRPRAPAPSILTNPSTPKTRTSPSSLDLPLQAPDSSPHDTSATAHSTPNRAAAQLAYELEQIQVHVDITNTRIKHLTALVNQHDPQISLITDLKRQLHSTHRALEKASFAIRHEHGEEMGDAVRDVVRAVWQAYRGMVRLEGMARGDAGTGGSCASSVVVEEGQKRWSGSTAEMARPVVVVGAGRPVTPIVVEKKAGVYIPTGARDAKVTAHVPVKVVEEGEGDEERRDGVLSGEGLRREIQFAVDGGLNAMRSLPPLAGAARETHAHIDRAVNTKNSWYDSHRHSISMSEAGTETHPEQWPQPRRSVIMRLQREEANGSLTLQSPTRPRRGSCNGFTITDMVMRGVEDGRFVLPYLHHIKHHEVRVLKQWLVEQGHLHNSGVVSCSEKILHCLQLLQTGNRYETIAVLFSRTPEQVMASCLEIVAGLLELYNDTVDSTCEQEVYASLWPICKKFMVDVQKAETYYGFGWIDVVQALIALNLYIGRSRGSHSPFEGEPFQWGKFLVPEQPAQLRHVSDRVQDARNSSDESALVDDSDDSSIYDTPVLQIISR